MRRKYTALCKCHLGSVPQKALVGAIVFITGCMKAPVEMPSTDDKHASSKSTDGGHGVDGGAHSAHGEQGKSAHHEITSSRKIVVKSNPSNVQAGSDVMLLLEIHDERGTRITQFETIHEKLVHLIIVRDRLDQFAHEHPEVASSGVLIQGFVFPTAGKYLLSADYQPLGMPPDVAMGELFVSGEPTPAPPLVPNVPGEIDVENLKAHIDVVSGDHEATVRFRLSDAHGQPVSDLQPYLGAMGHLVIIAADGVEYVHAHPSRDEMASPDRITEFVAHFPKAGLYKGWGQFSRNDAVVHRAVRHGI